MKQLSYTVRFVTPAFLGNALQEGQWRTPPFKALLRQWWRVVYAAEKGFQVEDLSEMRKEEGALFGTAADDKHARKSQIRIRLDDWRQGRRHQLPDIGKIDLGKKQVLGSLYSAYGPVGHGPKLTSGIAIDAGEEARLHLAFPEDDRMAQVLSLVNAYGTLGGRSRNGWGSLCLQGDIPEPRAPAREWETAMQWDWAHALGRDEKGLLVWTSQPLPSWQKAMRLLAQIRAEMRRAVPNRLILAYPDSQATMPGWEGNRNARVPHSIRFKVRSDGNSCTAVIFHMPCRPEETLWNALASHTRQDYIRCFRAAHDFLDRHAELNRAEV